MQNNHIESKRHFGINPDNDMSIQNLIEFQAVKSPDSFAVKCGEQQITYSELNHRANHLAHYLRNLGVRPEALVGICVTRSIEMVVGVLGILKAGGAYVPLDPSYPQQRLEFILEDARAQFIVTQSNMLDSFSKLDAQVVCLDHDSHEVDVQSSENPQKTTSLENLAYVIYTSGSTGKPKGVMITHANLCSFVRIAKSALDVTQNDKYLHNASVAYALSVRQLMVPLSCGATIVLATSEQTRDPFMLFQLVNSQNVTLMDMVPSFWRTSIQRLSDLPMDERQGLLKNHLRRIVSIGEPLLSDIPYDWKFKLEHPAELVNIFGQTETTGVVATYPIRLEPRDKQDHVVSIGRSVPGTQLYILNADLKPVRAGETGELCVSSPCLARGYLNQPELTAEKFVLNPFKDGISNRLYRTGDMARLQEDGNIQFIGRGDHQVKIRGQRLELGEVEVGLREYPGVSDCVAVARGDQPDDLYLVVYIVASANLSIVELRKFMQERVPEYMMPSAYVLLDALPLTPNGKVNRLALPDPVMLDRSEVYDVVDLPRDEIENAIAKIWRELLRLETVGIHDSFFDLGGHSLLAVRLFARLERDLGVRLPLTTLFHAATIAQLAKIVANPDDSMPSWSSVVLINKKGNKPPFFGIHGHEGGVLFWRDLVKELPEDQPFYAVQAQGVDGVKPPLTRIEDMASLYLSEIRKVQPRGPYYLGGYSMGGEIAFEISQELFRQGERVNLLVMLDTRNPARAARLVIHNAGGDSILIDDPGIHVTRSDRWKQKVLWHSRRLSELNLRGQVAYLIHNIVYQADHIVLFNLAKALRVLGKRLPDRLLLRYLRKSHSQALRNYVPIRYAGRVTLFRSSESLPANPDDSLIGWGPLAEGGLEVFHFNATHNLINIEYAEEVAQKLNECLVKARAC